MNPTARPNLRRHPLDLWCDDMLAYQAYVERVRFWRRLLSDYGQMLLILALFGGWYAWIFG